jgi:hypothetical protein
MTRNFTVPAALLMLAAFNPGAYAQDVPPDQAAEARRTIVSWLECEECTEGELEAVQKLGSAAVPTLGATLASGPSAASREKVRRHLETSYVGIAEYAKKSGDKLEISQEEYVKYYLENYAANYQVRSAQALAAIGGDEARKLLATQIKRKSARDDVQSAMEEAARGARR